MKKNFTTINTSQELYNWAETNFHLFDRLACLWGLEKESFLNRLDVSAMRNGKIKFGFFYGKEGFIISRGATSAKVTEKATRFIGRMVKRETALMEARKRQNEQRARFLEEQKAEQHAWVRIVREACGGCADKPLAEELKPKAISNDQILKLRHADTVTIRLSLIPRNSPARAAFLVALDVVLTSHNTAITA